MPNLINDEAGRANQAGKHGGRLFCPPGRSKLVPELRRFNEIGLQPMLAAFVSKRLGQMGLSGASRTNEGKIPVCIYRSQGADAFQLNIPARGNRESGKMETAIPAEREPPFR